MSWAPISRTGNWRRVFCRFLGHVIDVYRPKADRPFVRAQRPPEGFLSRCARCGEVWNKRRPPTRTVRDFLSVADESDGYWRN